VHAGAKNSRKNSGKRMSAGGQDAGDGENAPALKRSLSLPMLTLYGLGTTIGAGIYVLIGKVAGRAGMHMPVSFLLASLIAGLTVFTFAEFSSRFPKSAGEAVYLHQGFGMKPLSLAVGLGVMFAGLVSASAIARGFVGYLHEFVALPDWLAIVLLVAALGLVAAWGITESVLLATVATLIEIAGLLYVIWAARGSLAALPERLPELLPGFALGPWEGVLIGSVLAFYAFIGFEDMVNVAEEVRDAPRTLPRAIVLTLVVTTVLYLTLALIAVLGLPLDELARSDAPLSLLLGRATGGSTALISLVAIVAILNGALIQVVMAARVLYGLANQGWAPAVLARVHPATRTPLVATALVAVLVLALALWLPLVRLAEITSFLTLFVFAMVNLSLWRVKRRGPAPPDAFSVPGWVPIAGFFTCAGVIALRAASLAAG